MSEPLVIRAVEIEGRAGLDVRIAEGRIEAIGARLPRAPRELDGQGGALIPGLVDHHIHLLGLAARTDSVVLDGARGADEVAARISAGLASRTPGAWLRASGYHETMAGNLTRHDLDALAPRHRLRIQHQTGSLWMLNSAALASVCGDDDPPGVERGADGRPSGRIWREDAWLRERLGAAPPPLAPIGAHLAALGIVAVTDASVTTDASGAALLAKARRAGELPLRLTLMSGGELQRPADGAFEVGPVKILLDDHALPDFEDMLVRIGRARDWGRPVAVHCVTAGELALTLAAFETAGARPGDRIEHGGVIPASAIGQILALGLTVVTQPAFIRERGDRYAAEVVPRDFDDLYRCASLLAAGTPLAASSDAPYASPDPWLGMAAAIDRRSASGRVLGQGERVSAATALALYLGEPSAPGGPPRRVAVGAVADLCLLKVPLSEALADPKADHVAATLVGGELTYG